MKKKQFRAPRAKPGELKAQWGKLPHDNPDICVAWGEGIPHCDVALLHNTISSPVCRPDYSKTQFGQLPFKFDPTFTEELIRRGYDITTLKFSIMKKTEAES